jgi:short-subunit dehydrogenase
VPRTAVITGASSGIGAAFARRLAGQGYDLVLVARDEGRLRGNAEALRSAHSVGVEVLAADLATDEGCDAVAERLADPGRPTDLLVNNAGFSLNRSFVESTVERETALLRVNVHAVMRLSLAVLPGMVSRRRGAVINVSSVSGFGIAMPGSTYPATKAWVNSFSEAVALSVAPYGVRVMALCPGYVRTEFHQRAGIDLSKMPSWAWLDPDDLVAAALADLGRRKVISVPGWRYKTAVFALRHLPRGVVRRAARDPRGRFSPDEP